MDSEISITDDTLFELKNCRIVDVHEGCYMPAGSRLLCRNGRIQAVAAAQEIGFNPEISIDLGGRAVIPGLINTHCHLELSLPAILLDGKGISAMKRHGQRQLEHNMQKCLEYGVTTVRDTISEDLDTNRSLIRKISNGEIAGPRILQAVYVGMQGSCWSPQRGILTRLQNKMAGMPFVSYGKSNSGVVVFQASASEGDVRDAVDRAIDERGAEAIKIYEQREAKLSYKPGVPLMSEEQLAALVDQADKRGLKSTVHQVSIESFRRGIKAGVSSHAHIPIDQGLSDGDIADFIKSGGIIEPTLCVAWEVSWGWRNDPNRKDPRMMALDEQRRERMGAMVDEFYIEELAPCALAGIRRIEENRMKILGLIDLSAVFSYFSNYVTHGMNNTRRLIEAGATIACGNDGGIPPVSPAMLGLELEMMAMACRWQGDAKQETGGLSAAEALRIATINSARALGLEDSLGSIEAGKQADLVIYDDDPLKDAGVIGSRVAALFMGGRLVIDHCGLSS